ncbi:ATP-binding cassette domain-containing protein [Shewanella intestini]|uniref:ABC transporter ATP-binding protein n=1 Tax=Shewanella intestini TaxID=2017544 RepID=A0ABS5I3N2_9GAMM|nr:MULTISPECIES: ABC transporter ATP-binding protein [Shewanella]MBR9728638.1 ABC transporter ATP-binding protein [Shewanella intestini]MRG37306.1 ATP-binding cassette domain-containing protein [Shewanella sp. XMDDZSB0408]
MANSNIACIIAEHVTMHFDGKMLFSVQHLSFSQADVIYLQGDNGSGKSTLMKLLAGLSIASEGSITAHGFEKSHWWRKDGLVGKALYLHQHPYLFDGSVKYNLTFAAKQASKNKQLLTKRVEQAIEMAQLGHLLDNSASNLSGGERQRLAMARAWIIQPTLLMLDEPTSNMDKPSQLLVLDMIKQLKEEGTGLLLSSHQACGLTSLCNKHWFITNKQIKVSDDAPHNSDQTLLTTMELNYAN